MVSSWVAKQPAGRRRARGHAPRWRRRAKDQCRLDVTPPRYDRLTLEGDVTPVEEEVSAGRADAMLPAQLLQPGELIILLLKPSPWFIVLDALGSLVGLVAIIVVAIAIDYYGPTNIGHKDLALLGVGLIGLRLFWQFLEWLSRVYVLTDRRVVVVRGVLRVNVFETALKQIQHTNALFSVRERLFGLGTLAFSTAGTGTIESYWRMVARPLEVHRIVVQTINRYR